MHQQWLRIMWTEEFFGMEALNAIYGDTDIYNSANLRKVCFDNSTTTLHFDLATWPDVPPKKWIEEGANTVHCQLALAGCTETELKHWAPDNVGEFRVKRLNEDNLSVKFITNTGAYLSCVCGSAIITKVSAYQNA